MPDKIPTISFSISEVELSSLSMRHLVGDYAAWNYFQTIDRPENRRFIERFQARYGKQRVISDTMEAAYFGVRLWAHAVEEAGCVDVSRIRQAIRHQTFDAPEGMVRIDPETQHTSKVLMSDGKFESLSLMINYSRRLAGLTSGPEPAGSQAGLPAEGPEMTEHEIFLVVFDLPDPAGRAAYLDRACGGDAALGAEVEALLRLHDSADSLLDRPAVAPLDPGAMATQELVDEGKPADRADPEETLAFLAPPQRQGSLGQIGHYEVLEVLGRGGFGVVLRAFDEVLGPRGGGQGAGPEMAATSPARKRFLREARSSAKVRHENVVQVHAVEDRPFPYLVMEFVPGETLQERLDRTGPLEVPEVLQIGRQIAEGLAAAHASGLIHRDIKPANILIESGPHPHVKITDFGLARAADDASLTRSGLVAGTPMFMSPEQARGERVDHRTDLFSLGSVLYAMCSGRPPFCAGNTFAVLKRVAEDTPRPIPEVIPEVPPWLCGIIARLHAKEPGDRLDSAREVADLLAHGATGMDRHDHEPSAAVDGPARAVTASSPRRRRLVAAAMLVTALLALGFAEAGGVTQLGGTVIRLFSPEGTLVVEVDDPGVSVAVDGEDLVITGAGAREIRLRPGRYNVKASKDGRTVLDELVKVARGGRRVVRVSREAKPAVGRTDPAGGKSPLPAVTTRLVRPGAAPAAEEQVRRVAARLKELNPGFDGEVTPTVVGGVVTGLRFWTVNVTDISPVRRSAGIEVADLRGLRAAGEAGRPVAAPGDATGGPGVQRHPGRGPLHAGGDAPEDPLRPALVGKRPVAAGRDAAGVVEHRGYGRGRPAPLKGTKLLGLYLDASKVTDLSPLAGMPLRILHFRGYDWRPDRDGVILRSLGQLEEINNGPPAAILKMLDAREDPDRKTSPPRRPD